MIAAVKNWAAMLLRGAAGAALLDLGAVFHGEMITMLAALAASAKHGDRAQTVDRTGRRERVSATRFENEGDAFGG